MNPRTYTLEAVLGIERTALNLALMHGPDVVTRHGLKYFHFTDYNAKLFHLLEVAAGESETGVPDVAAVLALAGNEADSGIPAAELSGVCAQLTEGSGDVGNAKWYARQIIAGWKNRECVRLSEMLPGILAGERDGDVESILARIRELSQHESDTASAPPLPPRGAFPVEALPEPLQSMVRDAARQTSAPVSLCAAAGLGVISAAMGSGLAVESGEGRLTRGNIYILAFAESGTGKGQAFSVMAAPWLAAAKRMADEWRELERPRLVAEMEMAGAELERGKKDWRSGTTSSDVTLVASAEETIRDAIKRRTEAEAALARDPRLNLGNATAESIAETLAGAPGESGAIFSAEARDIVAILMGRYSKDGKGSDEAIYLQSYSGDPVTHNRKGRPAITLNAPCLTVCLAVQPDIWHKMAGDSRLMESGFLARCLAFDAQAPPARPSALRIPHSTAATWERLVEALLAVRECPVPQRVTPEPAARQVLDGLATESANNREAGGEWIWCTPFAARLAENAWRLALVLHGVAHGPEALTHPLAVSTAESAVALARWYFAETLALLAPARSQHRRARMERLTNVFRDLGDNSLPLWRLESNHGFSGSELRELASEFPHRLSIDRGKPGPQGGRPAESARLLSSPPPGPRLKGGKFGELKTA